MYYNLSKFPFSKITPKHILDTKYIHCENVSRAYLITLSSRRIRYLSLTSEQTCRFDDFFR